MMTDHTIHPGSDTRNLPATVQQELRQKIIQLRSLGEPNWKVAESLGISERHASATWQRYVRCGNLAIPSKQRGRREGQHKKLGNKHELQVINLLLEKPSNLGLTGELWTRDVLRQAIRRHLKINVSLSTVGSLLRSWGMIPQKPILVHQESATPKVQQWINKDYWKLVDRSQREGCQIHWCVEQPIKGCFSERHPNNRYHQGIPLLASISNQGQIRFMLAQPDGRNDLFTELMTRLHHDVDRKVLLLLKRIMSLHMDKTTEKLLAAAKDRIEVVYLPL